MTDSTGNPYLRMAEALADPARLFDQNQVLHLMGIAGRWGYDAGRTEVIPDEPAFRAGWVAGYEDAHAELTALAPTYPPPPFLVVAGVKVREDQAAAREAGDIDRSQRYAGGPVDDWGPVVPGVGETLMHTRGGAASFPELDGVSVRVRTVAGRIVWAEE